VDLD